MVTSARAITHDIIKKLYESNEAYAMTHSTESISKLGDDLDWGNTHTRCMLHFCYLLLFWCLLRYDEALGLEFHQVQLRKDDLGVAYLEVQLPFRKTHQTGSMYFGNLTSWVPWQAYLLSADIAPFFLYEESNAYLCPIRAFAKWCSLLLNLGEQLRGPIFRKPYAGGVFARDNALVRFKCTATASSGAHLWQIETGPIPRPVSA